MAMRRPGHVRGPQAALQLVDHRSQLDGGRRRLERLRRSELSVKPLQDYLKVMVRPP